MKDKLEFWFEFGSTYSYPAIMRISALANRHQIEFSYKPFLLGSIFKKQGWDTSPFLIFPLKGKYMWRDLERICEDLDISFKIPSIFPRNGLLASRIVCSSQNSHWIPDFIRVVFHSNFVEDKDISSIEVLSKILENLGVNAQDVMLKASLPETKEFLRMQTDRACEFGIFGAPTFRVGNEIFWGNDRLEAAIRYYKKVEIVNR